MADRLTVGVAARLSRYLQVLTQAKKMDKERISSQEISDYTNINATQIRRDLSAFGKFGKRGVGYNIDSLLGEIRKILRTQGQHNIALIGAGRLGEAIASSPIFAEHGINVAAVFDTDPEKVGRRVGNVEVSPYEHLPEDGPRQEHHRRRARGSRGRAPSAAADDLIGAGVKIIFNYSEALLDVPTDVAVHTSNPARRAPLRALLPPDVAVRNPVSGTGTCSAGRARTSTRARSRGSGAAPGTRSSLFCQERHPELYDLGGAELVRPEIGGVLPVFVLDRYEGLEARLAPGPDARGARALRRAERRGAARALAGGRRLREPRPARRSGRRGDRRAVTR